jgi:hypothetical protein
MKMPSFRRRYKERRIGPARFAGGRSRVTAAAMTDAAFPALRLRRTRASAWSRALFAETVLTPADLIWPMFIAGGQGVEEQCPSLPGVSRWSVDRLVGKAREARDLGIPCIALFPNTPPDLRTEDAREALNPGQPHLPRDQGGEGRRAGNRRADRRRARPLYVAWP